MDAKTLEALIREIPDFPKPGILFRDITPLLADAAALEAVGEALARPFVGQGIDLVLGIESRGFIFAPLVAQRLSAGFVPLRKPGKLPAATRRADYALEYGTDALEIHADALRPGQRVAIVDDLIATGGTAAAAAALAKQGGASVAGLSFLIELTALGGRRLLVGHDVHALLRY